MNNSSIIQGLLAQAWSMRGQGKYPETLDLVREAQDLCEEDDYNNLGRIFHIYMQIESDHDNIDRAIPYSQQSVKHYQLAGNSDRIAHAKRHLADLYVHAGKLVLAEHNYKEALSIYRSSANNSSGNLANALRGFAILLERQDKLQEAKDTWKEVKALYQNLGIEAGVAEADQKLANINF